jgi:hypothetical protein
VRGVRAGEKQAKSKSVESGTLHTRIIAFGELQFPARLNLVGWFERTDCFLARWLVVADAIRKS